jgi:hypothetical protein
MNKAWSSVYTALYENWCVRERNNFGAAGFQIKICRSGRQKEAQHNLSL